MQHVFAAKVRIFLLYDLGYSEIATADEDHIIEMRVVDGRTVGVADRFKHLSAQAHVKGFLGEDVGVQTSWDVGFAEIILGAVGQELQDAVDVLVVDHTEDEMEFFVVHLGQLFDDFCDASHIVSRVGDGQRIFVEDLPATHKVGVADHPADAVADVIV